MKLSSPVFLKDLKITRLFVLHNNQITHTRTAISLRQYSGTLQSYNFTSFGSLPLLSLVCLTAPYIPCSIFKKVEGQLQVKFDS